MSLIYFRANFEAVKSLPTFYKKRKKIQKMKKVSDKAVLFSGDIFVSPSLLKNNIFLIFLLKFISFFFDMYWKLIKPLIPEKNEYSNMESN
jgi:hypothetical protein